MNERIRDLAAQAGLPPFEDDSVGNRFKMEQFAELIVRECASVVFKKTGPRSALNVLEHFDIKEEWTEP